MYLRNICIKIIKVIRVVFNVIGISSIVLSVWNMLSLWSHYGDDYETIMSAKSTPEAFDGFILGCILVFVAYILKNIVWDANFFSSYFEGDLDGYVTFQDLADVTGKRASRIRRRLKFLKLICMKNYQIYVVNGGEQVVLNSKKYLCVCKNCGAPIEKRTYFTGTCSYCGSSDLYAKVIADNRFYCIENNVSQSRQKPSQYTAPNLGRKRISSIFLLSVQLVLIFMFTALMLDNIAKHNDMDYLRKVLLSGESYSSFDLIKKEMRDVILMAAAFIVALIPAVINKIRKLYYISKAKKYSRLFAIYKTPFVKVYDMPDGKNQLGQDKMMKAVRGALRRRYLINCTIEKHEGALMVALAKQIVKDRCINCGAPIVGAVDEHYKCNYCRNMIMGVIKKM